MNALNSKFGGKGSNFTIFGVPSNIFDKLEPGNNGTEILNGIRYVQPGNNFIPNFQLLEKVDVNGAKENKLYTYLKDYCPPTIKAVDRSITYYSPIKINDVAWNYETFLVAKNGRVIKRAPPDTDPKDLEDDIKEALQAH